MAQDLTTARDEALRRFQTEYDRLRTRIRENQQLIDQSQHEVERLRERNIQTSAAVRRVESNFDTIPRADIKAAYDEARCSDPPANHAGAARKA